MIEKRAKFSLQGKLGHEFQNDRAHDVPLSAAAQSPRNIGRTASRIYRSDQSKAVDRDGNPTTAALLYGLQRKAVFTQFSYGYTTVSRLILPAASRIYLIIQNSDLVSNIFLGFDYSPNGPAGLGLKILPGGYYEPDVIPQNDVYIAGSGVGNVTAIFAIG